MIPSRSYIDVTHEEPMEEEGEEPVLPKQPNSESIAPPKVRFNGKWPIDERGLPILPVQPPRPEAKQPLAAPMADVVKEYNPSSAAAGAAPEIEETSTDVIALKETVDIVVYASTWSCSTSLWRTRRRWRSSTCGARAQATALG